MFKFLSFPRIFIYRIFSFSLSFSLNSIKWKNVFSLITFRNIQYSSRILLLSNESFLYPNNIPWNLQTSQRDFLARKWYFNHQVSSPFPKQNWLLDLRRGWNSRMFKNFHSRTIIRFVLSIHHGHREEARGDVVQVSRPFFEDAHSNLLPLEMEEVRCLEESRSVFSHWNWIWTRGKRFESGNSRANVLAQESSGHEWKNCEPVFVQEDDRRKETRKHFSKEIEYQPAWFQTKLPGLIYRE